MPSAARWLPRFAHVADPARYVAREATERVLAQLEQTALRAAKPGLLLAPAGLGKTLLLRVLGQRLRDWMRPAYLPHPGLAPGELCAFALASLGRPAGERPEAELLGYAAELRGAGSGLLLLVDDADALDPADARGLAGLAAASHGDVGLVLAALDDARGGRLRESLGDAAEPVVLRVAMHAGETAAYVRRRLRGLGPADPLARLLVPDSLARIHALSGGIPGRVPFAIQQLFGEEARPPVGG